MKLLIIIKAHFKELFNMNKDIHYERMKICEACPLFENSFIGPLCNSSLYMNPETLIVSNFKKVGYLPGCGCRLDAKTRDEEEHCKFKKW